MQAILGRARRTLLLGIFVAAGGFLFLIGAGQAAQADEFGLITNDPDPCFEILGLCSGAITNTDYDARQDDTIKLVAAVCRDDSWLDICTDLVPGEVQLLGVSAFDVQYDMEGDGVANGVNDNGGAGWSSAQIDGACPGSTSWFGTTYCNLELTFPANAFKPGEHEMQTRICDHANTSNCSAWERWSLVGFNTDYDIRCTPGKDNDGDGVPCRFEAEGMNEDNDAVYHRASLKCVKGEGIGGITDLEYNLFDDFSVATVNNFCSSKFLGFVKYFGGQFAWADVTVQNGSVELALANLWTTNAVVSRASGGIKEAYASGLAICTDPDAPTIFKSDVGFCNFQTMMQDDDEALSVDEFQIKVTGKGFFGTSFNRSYGFDANGNRNPAISLLGGFEVTPA